MPEPLPASSSPHVEMTSRDFSDGESAHLLTREDGMVSRLAACAECGQDICGANIHGDCHACGTPIASTIDFRLREARLNPDGRLTAGVCQFCAYDLRGVHFDAPCPECGIPVRRSAYAGDPRFDDPGWLRRIMLGAGFMATGISLFFGLLILAIANVFAPLFFGSPFVALILAAGVWLTTTPHPQAAPRAAYDSDRRAARWTLLGPIAVIGALATMQFRSTFMIGLGSLILASLAVGTFFYARALHAIARRVLCHETDARAAPANSPWQVTLGPALLALVGAGIASLHSIGGSIWFVSIGGLICVAAFAWYLLLLAACGLHCADLATRIAKALPAARQNWPDRRPIGPPESTRQN